MSRFIEYALFVALWVSLVFGTDQQSCMAFCKNEPTNQEEKAYQETRVFLKFRRRMESGELVPVQDAFFWLPHHAPRNKDLGSFKYETDDLAAATIEKRNDGLHPYAQYIMTQQLIVFINNSDTPFDPVTDIPASIPLIKNLSETPSPSIGEVRTGQV